MRTMWEDKSHLRLLIITNLHLGPASLRETLSILQTRMRLLFKSTVLMLLDQLKPPMSNSPLIPSITLTTLVRVTPIIPTGVRKVDTIDLGNPLGLSHRINRIINKDNSSVTSNPKTSQTLNLSGLTNLVVAPSKQGISRAFLTDLPVFLLLSLLKGPSSKYNNLLSSYQHRSLLQISQHFTVTGADPPNILSRTAQNPLRLRLVSKRLAYSTT